MNAPGDIVLAEIPCTSCGYNLHMQPAEGRCPECGASIAGTLEKTLLLRGYSQIRRIAGAMRLTAILNIGLVVLFVIFVLAPVLPPPVAMENAQAIPIVCFIGLAMCALLQVIAALRTTTPPPRARLGSKRLILIIGGSCFVTSMLAPLIIFTTQALPIYSNWPEQFCFGTLVLCFPGLGVFVWTVGAHYAALCTLGGIHRLAPWARRIGGLLALGAALKEMAFLALLPMLLNDFRGIGGATEIFMDLGFYGGLLLIAAGLLAAIVLLFAMSKRLGALGQTVGENPVLSGPPPRPGAIPPR